MHIKVLSAFAHFVMERALFMFVCAAQTPFSVSFYCKNKLFVDIFHFYLMFLKLKLRSTFNTNDGNNILIVDPLIKVCVDPDPAINIRKKKKEICEDVTTEGPYTLK